MNKKKIKSILLSSIGLMTIVATPLIATSCAKTNTSNNSNAISNVEKKTYDSKVPITKNINRQTTNSNSGGSTTTNNPKEKLVLDPNLSDDAKKQVDDTFKDDSSMTKEKLQMEYDKVLTKFYKMYEYESKDDKKIEIEAEIKKIVVKNFDKTNLKVDLTVTYEVETEKKDDNKRDKDKDKEDKKDIDQEKTVTLKPTFASEMEIAHITETLRKTKGDYESGKSKIDVKDLYELYVGDKDDGKESIFEKTNSILSASKFGGLLGYELDLLDLAYTPSETEKPNTIKDDKNESNTNKKESFKIFAPSYVINHFYVPDQTLTNGIDLTLNYDVLKTKTWEEIKAINNEATLSPILKNPPKTEDLKNLIVKVETKDKEEKPTTPPSTPSVKKETSTNQTTPPSTPTNPTVKKDIVLEITVKKDKNSQETILVALEIKNEWLKKTTTTPPAKPEEKPSVL